MSRGEDQAPGRLRAILRTPWFFAIVVAVLFFGLGLAIVLRHEMWRDEFEAWLVGRDSASLGAVFRTARYTGHPVLWYVCLYLVSRVATAPEAMQLFHVAIATATAFVIARWAPFPRVQRVLLAFGYFFFYEYAVISRNYAFGALFLVAFCAAYGTRACGTRAYGTRAYGTRRRTYLAPACLLFLLAQTSVFGLILSGALASGLVLEAWCDRSVRASLRTRKLEVALSAAIVLCGFAACIAQVVPPADAGTPMEWRTTLEARHLSRTLATIWLSYVPIPALKHEFWESNIVSSLSWLTPLSAGLLCLGLMCFVRRPVVLAVYVVGTVGLLLFAYVVFRGHLRHHGHLYLLFVACLWLAQAERGAQAGRAARWRWHGPYRATVFVVLLSSQLVAGLIAAGRDWRHPFTAGEAAAAFIVKEGLDDLVIIGDADNVVLSVVGHLDREVYYTMSRRFGTFIVWNDQRRFPVTRLELVETATRMSAERQTDVLLVLSYGVQHFEYPVVELGRFGDTMVADERYWLYVVKYDGVQGGGSRGGARQHDEGRIRGERAWR